MAINKDLPVTATVITRRIDPGFYERRVGQTLSNPSPVQWLDQDGANIGSPSRFLLLTEAMVYQYVQAGVGGTKYLVLPSVTVLSKSTDQTPSTTRGLAFNRNGLTEYDASRPFIDWMKFARIVTQYDATLAVELNGVTTSVVVNSAIPSDLPQTGTLTNMGQSRDIAYTSWSGSTFTIESWNFASAPRTVGSSVRSFSGVNELQTSGVLDSDYWPTKTPNFTSAITLLWADVTPDWAGEYFNVTWTGTGNVAVGGSFTNVSSTSNTRRIRMPTTISPTINVWLNTTGQVSDITVIPERYATEWANGQTFRPELLEFDSATRMKRFMDWQSTNRSGVSSWSERPLESHSVYLTGRGVPLETIVQYAVDAGIDEIYLCVPHLATNAYCTSFGQWLEANIPTGMKVTVEYSNEASWNFIFSQTNYMWSQANVDWGFSGLLQTALTGTTTSVVVQGSIPAYCPQTGSLSIGGISPNISYTSWSGSTFTIPSTDFSASNRASGSSVSTVLQGYDWYGKRAAEVMYLISQEFTGDLVRACGVQTANTATTTGALLAPQWNTTESFYSDSLGITMSAPHNYFDAIAVTNYVYANLTNAATITAMRAAYAISDEAGHQFLFNKFMEQDLGLQQTDGWLRAQKAIADSYGLKMIAYEGGNHAVYVASGGNAPPADANQAENLEYLYSFYQSDYWAEVFYHLWIMWEQVGDGPFVQFSDVGAWSLNGVWTMREDLGHEMYSFHQVANWLSRNRPQWWT